MWLGKRLFDFVFALLGLIVLFPLFAMIALWVKFDSKGPIFFRQKRVGLNEKIFKIHKFRTMTLDAEKNGLQITVGNDSRITSSGRFIRKYKIDEFPQLIDVLRGEMSLVGPRPEVPSYVEYYPAEIKKKVFQMRPGITDWASIKFKDENFILGRAQDPERAYIEEILPIKLRYFVEYHETASCLQDFKIIFSTLREVFRKS